MINEEEIRERIQELMELQIDEQARLRALINEVKDKRNLTNKLKKERDELNAKVKETINEAKKHLSDRDRIQNQIKKRNTDKKSIFKQISRKAQTISKTKEERDKLNKEAKGYQERLRDQMVGSIKTLLGMDLSLKNEIIMVEMIFDFQGRLKQKMEADKLHQEIQTTYKDLKSTESQLQGIFGDMGNMMSKSQNEHKLAQELFLKKDELRKEAQEAHNKFIENNRLVKDLSLKIDASKLALDKIQQKIKREKDKLGNIKKRQREEEKKAKLETAKTKMKTSGKMGMDDLRLLLESGELKLDKK
jgi:phosphoserine phosphatase